MPSKQHFHLFDIMTTHYLFSYFLPVRTHIVSLLCQICPGLACIFFDCSDSFLHIFQFILMYETQSAFLDSKFNLNWLLKLFVWHHEVLMYHSYLLAFWLRKICLDLLARWAELCLCINANACRDKHHTFPSEMPNFYSRQFTLAVCLNLKCQPL